MNTEFTYRNGNVYINVYINIYMHIYLFFSFLSSLFSTVDTDEIPAKRPRLGIEY